jgi:hypothetical protein
MEMVVIAGASSWRALGTQVIGSLLQQVGGVSPELHQTVELATEIVVVPNRRRPNP